MSLWFYAYFNISYLPLILSSILVNYAVCLLMKKAEKIWIRRALLLLGASFDLGLLFYYKYFDFFSENINALFSTDLPLRDLILPLGISFFTFQQLSFLIDSYKREAPEYSFFDYALFVTFFPQLIAGPIVTHDELIPQFADREKRTLSFDNLARGSYLFALGLSKKVLLADVFGIAVNCAFSDVASLTTGEALCAMLGYTLQIYLDFSGYCDMAAGIARMMNIELPENFNSPYKSHSIVEFWRRWHMTLTRFFTKYIYIPLGGSKRGLVRTYLNILIVFLASGIWHGAAWTFLLWGILHGVMSVLTRAIDKIIRKIIPLEQPSKRFPLGGRIAKLVGVVVTFAFVSLTWVIFRAESITDALTFFERLFSDRTLTLRSEITRAFAQSELTLAATTLLRFNLYAKYPSALMLGFFALSLGIVFFMPNARRLERRFTPTILRLIETCVLLVWCIFSLSGLSTFLYFNF